MTRLVAKLNEAEIDTIFAGIDQCHLPGAAVAVAIDGVPVYRKGFGLAHMELPVILGPRMRMRIGSTTKHFAALIFLLLCEEGRAGIDDPIGEYLPALHAASRDVTMRQLMGHTSGLRDAMAVSLTINGTRAAMSDRHLVALYETIDDVEFEHGTSWSYNNGGYILLTAAIERITGESLDTLLRTRIFEPIGMFDTMLRRWDTDFVPNSAALHFRMPDGRFTRDAMAMEISGAGGLVSTMDDMLRWLRHMDAPIVGSTESWRLMREPHRLANGTSTGYGLGLITSDYRGATTISHGGGVVAGNSQMIKVPAAGLDISIAVNRADVSGADLANRIIDACVEGLDPRTETPFEKRDAVYLSQRDGRVVELAVQNDMQFLAVDNGPALPVTADEAGDLRLPDILSFVLQKARPAGETLCFTDFGDEDHLDRIDVVADAKIDNWVGEYRATSVGADAIVSLGDGAPRLTIRGPHGIADYALQPVNDTIWRAMPTGPFAMLSGMLAFSRERRELAFSCGRMRRLAFAKVEFDQQH
jgi:CubicO group peptidase (beta-lactamase class C family)